MEEKFTRFITFREIKKYDPDIYTDAFGIESLTDLAFSSVETKFQGPDEKVIIDLFDKIKKDTKVH